MSTARQNLAFLHDTVEEDLLLNLTPASVAYSLRKLDLNYTGDSVRVRRSSDNAEQDIGFDANGDLDTAALNTFVGANDGFVTTLYDQSGNTINATQTTDANQPTIVSAGTLITENGLPAFETTPTRFLITDAITPIGSQVTASLFTVNSIPGYDGVTFFVILEQSNRGLEHRIFTDINSLVNLLPVVGLTSASPPPDTDQHYITSLFRKQGDSDLFVNGVFGENTTNGSLDNFGANSVIRIGRRTDGTLATTCRWAEIILYNTDQRANRLSIEANQKAFYGTP